jgi:hypothetical protein
MLRGATSASPPEAAEEFQQLERLGETVSLERQH